MMLHLSLTHQAQRMIVTLQRVGMTHEAKEALLDCATAIAKARGAKMIGRAALEQALDELSGDAEGR